MATDLAIETVHTLGNVAESSVPISDPSAISDADATVEAALERFVKWTHSKSASKYGKFTFVQGILDAETSPESASCHSFVKSCVAVTVGHLCRELRLGRIFIDRMLLVRKDVLLATEPDLMFFSNQSFRDGKFVLKAKGGGSPKPGKDTEMHGTPDLVVEIVSPSSVVKDKTHLKKAYFDAGIPEYWLIDARDQRLEFTIFTRSDNGYVATAVEADGYQLSTVFQRAFLLQRVPDPYFEVDFELLNRMP